VPSQLALVAADAARPHSSAVFDIIDGVAQVPAAPDKPYRILNSVTIRLACVVLAALTVPTVFAQTRQPDVIFVPTRESVADDMLRMARVTSNDVIYDLGSGDGRILMLAAQKYGASGVGVEIDPKLVEKARSIARDGQVEGRVRFINGDLFETDISPATVVTIYLSPSVNARLEPKLRAELRPGTRVVSHQFPIGRWTPDKTMDADDGTRLFLWTIPARPAGQSK
jgi:SAM-dependent methyltransferase